MNHNFLWKQKQIILICPLFAEIPPTYPPQLPGHCPEPKRFKPWVPFRGHCYVFLASRSENWAHATVECMRMGMFMTLFLLNRNVFTIQMARLFAFP